MASKNQAAVIEEVKDVEDVKAADASAPQDGESKPIEVKNPIAVAQFGTDVATMLSFEIEPDEAAKMTIGKYAKKGHDGIKVSDDNLVSFQAEPDVILAAIATLPTLKAVFADGVASTMQAFIDGDAEYAKLLDARGKLLDEVAKLEGEMRTLRIKSIAPFDASLVNHGVDWVEAHRPAVVASTGSRRGRRNASNTKWDADRYPYYRNDAGALVSTVNPGGYGDIYIGRVGTGTKAFGIFMADGTPAQMTEELDANGVPTGNIVELPVGDSVNQCLRAWLESKGMGTSVSAPAYLSAEETEDNAEAYGLF